MAILTFHSGEDRLVKKSFQRLHRSGIYKEIARMQSGLPQKNVIPMDVPDVLNYVGLLNHSLLICVVMDLRRYHKSYHVY